MQPQRREPWEYNAERILALRKIPLKMHMVVEPPKEKYVDINFIATLCSDCQLAISDVLTQTYPSERWLRSEGSDAVIAIYKQHHSNVALQLKNSGLQGCEMCILMYDILHRNGADISDSGLDYYVFVKMQPVDRYRLRLCMGDVSRFTRHMREWATTQDTLLQFFSLTVMGPRNQDHVDLKHSVRCSEQKLLHLQKLPSRDVSREDNIQNIRMWRGKCHRDHTNCTAYRRLWLSEGLPRRLVDIAAIDTQRKVHLCFPKPEDKWEYATVTYSWGNKGENRRISTRNNSPSRPHHKESDHVKGIDIKEFPNTLQDAMRVAQKLNIRYLWIDSICIVQGDEVDMSEQVAALVQIYARADLNISATSGLKSEYGILRDATQHGICVGHIDPLLKPEVNQQWQQSICVGTQLPVVDLEDMVTATRAWIFQERLVSPATVHFTDTGLIWECTEHLSLDREQLITNTGLKSQWALGLSSETDDIQAEASNATREMVFQYWNQWIAAYAAREIKRLHERLFAISSMISTVQRRFGLCPIAGVWKEDIINSLLWSRNHRCELLTKLAYDDFPSWSWISVQGKLNFMRKTLFSDYENGPVITFIGIEPDQEISDTSLIPRNRIKLRGFIQKVTVDQDVHPGTGQRDSQEVGIVSGFRNVTNVMVLLDVPTGSVNQYEYCWFIRVGSYYDGSRKGDLFLVLQQVDEQQKLFKRIGFARTEPWFDSTYETPQSGAFSSPEEDDVTLM